MRTHLCPVGSLVTQMDVVVADVHNQAAVSFTARLGQLAVQVHNILRPRLLVQVVDILRDYLHIIILFQPHQLLMTLVGLHGSQLATALVVKVQHQSLVLGVALRRSHILNTILLPQAVAVAEGADSALGANTSAS